MKLLASFFISLFSLCAFAGIEVIHSPGNGFIDKMKSMITAKDVKTIDISIYSFGSSKTNPVLKALLKAKNANPDIEIRVVMDKGNADRKPQIVEILEALGADVRTVNKINHHKFMIVNGIHCDLMIGSECTEDPMDVRILQGSGNFNTKADYTQDESFTVITEEEIVGKQYSKVFATLWNHSKDLGVEVFKTNIKAEVALKITQTDKKRNLYSLFTEDNYKVKPSSTTFRANGEKVIASFLAEKIRKAKKSVKIAHTHFKMKDVAQALLEKLKDPNFKVYLYLDNQNFTSMWGIKKQKKKLDACAGELTCGESGIQWFWPLLFANGINNDPINNIEVRFKYYMYKWDHIGAVQMHSKYVIIDDKTVVSGSYNLSLNSETKSFEDTIVLESSKSVEQKNAVREFVENFDDKWSRNRSKLSTVKRLIKEGAQSWGKYPLSLDWEETENLRKYFRTHNPRRW